MTPAQAKAVAALAAPEILGGLELNQRLFVEGLVDEPERSLKPYQARYLESIAAAARRRQKEAAEGAAPAQDAPREAGSDEDAPPPVSVASAEGHSSPLEFHPLANLFPLIEGREFDELVDDVRGQGLLEEIVMLEGRILDGRNRYRAGVEAGLFPADVNPETDWRFVTFSDTGLDGIFPTEVVERGPLAFVLSKNLSRRHLSESQRAMVAADVATMRQGERTDRAEPSANLQKVSQGDAARMLHVSPRSVASAARVRDHGMSELREAVRQGKLSISAAALIARLSEDDQRSLIAAIARQADTRKAFAGVVKELRREAQDRKKARRETREADLGRRQRALPTKRYGVILGDPEWRFKAWSAETGMDRAPDNHYPTSETADIVARKVEDIAAEDCALFLWATAPMLEDALDVIAGWGFTYKTHVVWTKDRPGEARGPGYWFTGEHELLLLATRGDPPCPAPGDQWRSSIAGAVGVHSEKPDWQYEMIEAYFPTLPKIELNARRARPGWDAWGLEAPEAEAT